MRGFWWCHNTDIFIYLICGKGLQAHYVQCTVCICGKGVQANSIQCTVCIKWIRCSGICGDLSLVADGFSCTRCDGTIQESDIAGDVVVDGETYRYVNSFSYLEDTLDGDGVADLAVTARIRNGWMKFREVFPFLTSRAPPLKMKGRVYARCVRSTMTYGSETRPWLADVLKLERAEMQMIRWIVSMKNRRTSEELFKLVGVEPITTVIRSDRLYSSTVRSQLYYNFTCQRCFHEE